MPISYDVLPIAPAVRSVQFWLTHSILQREHGQELSVFNTYFLSFTFSSVTVATVLTGLQVDGLEWLDLLYFFSYIKLYISFAKYLPQVSRVQKQSHALPQP